jgi:hypothetical protein
MHEIKVEVNAYGIAGTGIILFIDYHLLQVRPAIAEFIVYCKNRLRGLFCNVIRLFNDCCAPAVLNLLE